MTRSANAELGSITSKKATLNRMCDIELSMALPGALIPVDNSRLQLPKNDLGKDRFSPKFGMISSRYDATLMPREHGLRAGT
jgi:hypothetical protein